jgi:hypothetical protein
MVLVKHILTFLVYSNKQILTTTCFGLAHGIQQMKMNSLSN